MNVCARMPAAMARWLGSYTRKRCHPDTNTKAIYEYSNGCRLPQGKPLVACQPNHAPGNAFQAAVWKQSLLESNIGKPVLATASLSLDWSACFQSRRRQLRQQIVVTQDMKRDMFVHRKKDGL